MFDAHFNEHLNENPYYVLFTFSEASITFLCILPEKHKQTNKHTNKTKTKVEQTLRRRRRRRKKKKKKKKLLFIQSILNSTIYYSTVSANTNFIARQQTKIVIIKLFPF